MDDIRTYESFPLFKAKFLSNLPKNYNSPEMKKQCWEWQAAKKKDCYSIIYWNAEYRYYVHRVSYIIFKGLIPYGEIVRHTCDNKNCVNPNHLILGSHQDNSIDMVKRNRQSYQKLNTEAVKVIKWMLKYKPRRGLPQKLASLHNVSIHTIRGIKNNQNWRHVKV
jgi:hypothetical protein